jgi:SAM-dependent methyltransferase
MRQKKAKKERIRGPEAKLVPGQAPTGTGTAPAQSAFDAWLTALEARHLADLRIPEVTRALRALSSAYVERRHKVREGSTLDSAGKRAAFALFFGPLHYLATERVLDALGAAAPASILDIGCGTGAAGAAWALHGGGGSRVLGMDRHPWAVAEARWTFRQLGLNGQARIADLTRLPHVGSAPGIVAAYVLNELPDVSRERLETGIVKAGSAGSRVLVLEPIARGITPWWGQARSRFVAAGGRADEWRFPVELPPLLQLLDRAAGLDHRELTVRSLSMNLDR